MELKNYDKIVRLKIRETLQNYRITTLTNYLDFKKVEIKKISKELPLKKLKFT